MSVREAAAMLERARPSTDRALDAAREVVEAVRARGDAAVLEFSERFDGVRPSRLVIRRPELEQALDRTPADLREALAFAASQIEAFHRMQLSAGYEIPIGPAGSRAGQQPRALGRVGVYVPGGPRGYPSSALMGCLPARIAGVDEIVVATPPARDAGRPPDAVLASAFLGGADEVLVAGGAQAIAALAYGTESVRPVDKIVGPGNAYVTAAKRLVADRVATDGIAGPSEVFVVADDSLPREAFAAELLAQAEHDADAVALGITVGEFDFAQLGKVIEARAQSLPRAREALDALSRQGALVQVSSVQQAIDLANALAPEHLVLAVRDARAYLYAVRNAGCVFLGPSTTAALGDYTAGTNHDLPTAGSARWRGGLSVRDFVKFVSFVEAAPEDLRRLSGPAATIARAEGFDAHAAALVSRATPGRPTCPAPTSSRRSCASTGTSSRSSTRRPSVER
ncbi:MAG: histidinol dehydrogenase [Methanobacteriota archaeon]